MARGILVVVLILVPVLIASVSADDLVESTTPTKNTTKPSIPHPGDHPPPNASYIPALEEYLHFGENRTDGGYHYDSTIRPSMFSEFEIEVFYYLIGIGEVDEKRGRFQTNGLLYMTWADDRLIWEPAKFGNVQSIVFQGYKFWTPTFFHNGNEFVSRYSMMTATLFHTGHIVASVSLNEETPCVFDMKKFPRDTQTCYIELYQPDHQVKLTARDAGSVNRKITNPLTLIQHAVWETQNVSISSSKQSGGDVILVDIITIGITIKRNANFFLRIYVAPVCFLLLLIPIIFLLPPDSSEKLTYGAVLLFCMIYVSQSVEAIYPPYTKTMPYLLRLTTASGALLFLCIFLSSLISSAERIGRKRAVPAWMKRYVIGKLGKLLCVKENEDALSPVHVRTSGDNDKSYIVQDEQGADFSDTHVGAANSTSDNQAGGDTNQALQSLVNELKQSRLQNKAYDDWTNIFTIINRFLFLLTLLIGIVIIFCFA